MNTSRHHADWLSLVEVSGPFLSLPVLLRVFPQGLDARDSVQAKALRDAYDEWQKSPTAPGRQRGWILHVLTNLLGYPSELVTEGQTLPAGLEANVAQMGETLRPDFAVVGPKSTETAGQARLIISTYPLSQPLDRPVADRHWKAIPATRMTELLHASGIPLGLVTNGEHWMLVYAPRGETTGYASWYSALWLDEPITLRAFHSLLGVHRFFGVDAANTLLALLKESAQDQQEVTDQLGYQVREAVQVLVQAFDTLDQDSNRMLLKGLSSNSLYDAALTVMMRLVFLFSAEERGLLHLGKPLYDDNYAVSTLMEQLQDVADRYGPQVLERRSDAWARLLATFRAVHGGVNHQDLMMPAYGGSLFDPDRYPFLEGRPAGTKWSSTPAELLPINNRVVLHLLSSLQRLRVKVPGGGPAEARRVSYRALGVEQIGHVYEGLLDHTAVRATEPVLGLKGTRDNETEIALSTLEKLQAKGAKDLIEFLKEETGRSEKAIQKALGEGTLNVEHPLLISCGHNDSLAQRVRSFIALVREDSFDRPMVILPGSVYVTVGSTRRSTGTHYTPPSLTEPIVQHTLEPLVYSGPAEGLPQNQWELKSPQEILELKVCDMAMGSGAFLVQACRYLSERLAESWENEEKRHPDEVLITPEGGFSQGVPSERLIPQEAAERIAVARRIVADRCLYGVDINPMAVEMAKLSMWLITLDAKRPFTFLDHAFKCGDSLIGLCSFRQLEDFSLRPGGVKQVAFSTMNLWRHVAEAKKKRETLEATPSDTPEQIAAKVVLYNESEEAVAKLKAAADILVAAELKGLKGSVYEADLEATADRMMHYWPKGTDDLVQFALDSIGSRRTLHWPLMFPEIMERGGFDSFVGNPPFLGGKRISTIWGPDYNGFLKIAFSGSKGAADICAYFFRRAHELIRLDGTAGLLATNTIAQADTREVGLDVIARSGGTFYRVQPLVVWPGTANVHVSLVHWRRGTWNSQSLLGNEVCARISSRFEPETNTRIQPQRIRACVDNVSSGVGLMGMGFVVEREMAESWIDEDDKYREILQPYMNGQEFNATHDLSPQRYAINFRTMTEEEAALYPLALSRVRELVKPDRDKLKGQIHESCYWRYWDSRESLYRSISPLSRVLVCAMVTKFLSFAFLPKGWVYSQKLIVFPTDRAAHFALLQSCFHEAWVRFQSPTLKSDLSYSVSDAFRTFATPESSKLSSLDPIGEEYHEFRRLIMLAHTKGLTSIYNRFHDPSEDDKDVLRLRDLHVGMDQAVAAAYELNGIELCHGFRETKQGLRFTISEAARLEIIERLLNLNHQRHAEQKAEEKLTAKQAQTATKRGRNRTSTALEEPTLQFETE